MAPALATIGLFLCFWGGRLLRPTLQVVGLVVGVGLGYWVGSYFERPEVTWALVAVGAAAFIALIMLVFSSGIFILGALAGGVVYKGVEGLLGPQLALPGWGMLVAAAVSGMLALWLQSKLLAIFTSIVGGFMFVEAGVRMIDGQITQWGEAPGWATHLLIGIAWFIMSFAGILAQKLDAPNRGDK